MVACARLDEAGGVGWQVTSRMPDLSAAPVGTGRYPSAVLVFVL
jgi:hypothetical protein